MIFRNGDLDLAAWKQLGSIHRDSLCSIAQRSECGRFSFVYMRRKSIEFVLDRHEPYRQP